MTARGELDRGVASWMHDATSSPPPPARFEQAMAATARVRPRPRWMASVGSDWVGTTGTRRREWLPLRPGRALLVVALVALLIAAAIFGWAFAGGTLLNADRSPGPSGTVPVETAAPSATGGPPATPGSATQLVGPADRSGSGPPVIPGTQLAPGTYEYLDVDGTGFNVRFTVPEGWTWNGGRLNKGGGVDLPRNAAAIYFLGGPVQVYADPCHWGGTQSNPPTGPSVIDLMDALVTTPNFPTSPARSTTPTSRPMITRAAAVPGMAVELGAPDTFAGCDGGQFRIWGPDSTARINDGPEQHDLVWAVNVSGGGVGDRGQRLIIDVSSFNGTPNVVMAETEAILGSIYAGHWG